MENFGRLISAIMVGMQRDYVIYGHTISMWQIYMLVIVAGILCTFIGRLINGD